MVHFLYKVRRQFSSINPVILLPAHVAIERMERMNKGIYQYVWIYVSDCVGGWKGENETLTLCLLLP